MGNKDDTDIVWCLDAATGNEIWTHRYPEKLNPKLYEGVRDTLRLLVSDLLTQTPLSAASKSSVEAFLAASEPLMLGVGPLYEGFVAPPDTIGQ